MHGRTQDEASRRLRPVFIGATALLVVLLAVFAYALAESQDRQRTDTEKRFDDRADVAAAVNEAIFTLSTDQIKATDAARFGGKAVDEAALRRRAAQSQQVYSQILSSEGEVLAATRGAPAEPSSGDHVTKALKSGRTEYSSLMEGPGGAAIIESATAFQTRYGVRVDVSAINGELLSAFLNSFLSKIPSVEGARSYVLDPSARVIATPGAKSRAGGRLEDAALAQAVRDRGDGTYGDRYFTSAPIAGTPWSIVISVSQDDLYSSVNTAVPWIIFGGFVLVSALGLFLLRRVLKANTELERAELSRRHALEINDNVVQRLVLAKYALDRGATETSQQKLAETLRETQQLVSSLLEQEEIRPGSLRREAAADTEAPPQPHSGVRGPGA